KTMRDVGAALGVSEDAAKMRVSRAVDRLRTQLGIAGGTCTVAMLGAMLAENCVQAAPGKLIAGLAAMSLPIVEGAGGTAGWLACILRTSKLKLAAGAVVLALLGWIAAHNVRSGGVHAPEEATEISPESSAKSVP